mmetsp:Transcript_43749/g.126395  ORF Transcript_43749/g.126395 Transcript_43749/m.126395 type:complete len:242 (-) Transcript_43749:732-1457(-)
MASEDPAGHEARHLPSLRRVWAHAAVAPSERAVCEAPGRAGRRPRDGAGPAVVVRLGRGAGADAELAGAELDPLALRGGALPRLAIALRASVPAPPCDLGAGIHDVPGVPASPLRAAAGRAVDDPLLLRRRAPPVPPPAGDLHVEVEEVHVRGAVQLRARPRGGGPLGRRLAEEVGEVPLRAAPGLQRGCAVLARLDVALLRRRRHCHVLRVHRELALVGGIEVVRHALPCAERKLGLRAL